MHAPSRRKRAAKDGVGASSTRETAQRRSNAGAEICMRTLAEASARLPYGDYRLRYDAPVTQGGDMEAFGALIFAATVVGVVLAICWIVFLPFALIGTKPLLRQILAEQTRTNELLAIRRGAQQPAQ